MTLFRQHPALRWLVPLLAAVLLGVGGSAVGIITATARGGLPHRGAATLLVDVQTARLDGLSGTVVQNADLGLPSLPGIGAGAGGSGSSDMTSLVAGSHTLRLWYADPNHARLALLGSLGESDLVRNGRNLWSWSSQGKRATHHTVPLSKGDAPRTLASVSPTTPQQAADAALKAITPTTKVSTDGTAVVAGRSAYELVLEPRGTGSLIESVRIAIDGKTHVPTRVQVYAHHASKPGFEVGFTSFDPSDPPASVFRFNPPPGTTVSDSGSAKAPGPGFASPGTARPSSPRAGHRSAAPKVVGKGWTSVVVARVPAAARRGAGSSMMTRLVDTLPKVSGDWGSGHVLRGTLFSAVLTRDGRIAIGAVRPDALYAALGAR